MTTRPESSSKERTHRVVVGIDGSEGSNRALEWAAIEAARRGAVLEAHTSYGPGYEFITPEEVHMATQRVLIKLRTTSPTSPQASSSRE